MKNTTLQALVLMLMAGCSEQVSKNYATYADAHRAGAVDQGWIPEFVPPSARNITDSHNVDTNRQTLQFTISAAEAAKMVTALHSVPSDDYKAADELSRKHGIDTAYKAYVVCSEPINGVLLVDYESNRAIYDTTVDWVADNCERQG